MERDGGRACKRLQFKIGRPRKARQWRRCTVRGPWLARHVRMPLAALPTMLAMIREQQVRCNRLITTGAAQRGEVCHQGLPFVSSDEGIMKPAPLQRVGQRRACEWTGGTCEQSTRVKILRDRANHRSAGNHLDRRWRRFCWCLDWVEAGDGFGISAGGKIVIESPTSLASKPRKRMVVVYVCATTKSAVMATATCATASP